MKRVAGLLLLLANAAVAGIPFGLSTWHASSCSTTAASGACPTYEAELIVFRSGNEVCGTIVQTWADWKSPSAWYRGRIAKDGGASLLYFDSFQSDAEHYIGKSAIHVRDANLNWSVLSLAPGGYISSEPHFVPTKANASDVSPATCDGMQEGSGLVLPKSMQ
jgi:hypothetical protein